MIGVGRSVVIQGALALLLPGATAALEVNFVSVAEGVYAHIGDKGGRTYENEGLNANIGLIVTPAGAVLIDSGASRSGAAAIHAAIKRVTAQPLRYVINTGGQDHRWLGNGYFVDLGVPVIAAAAGRADMVDRGRDQLNALKPILKEKLERTEPVLPTEWFERQRVVELGDKRIELHHAGGGHTPGDLFVWLPQSGVVFAGDIVYTDRLLGILPVSRTQAWLASFAALEALQPRTVVPGHGEVTTLKGAQQDTKSYLVAVRAHMKAAVDAGTDLQQAIRSFDDKRFAHLLNYEDLRGGNASRAYLEAERE